MPPTKVCSQCKAVVHIRRKVCESCDHVFRSKRAAECKLPERAMKCIRVLQSDSEKSVRQAKDKLCKASKRASETRERTLQRQQLDRLHKASMRATETCEQTLHRQQQDRLDKANMRATETCEQTLHRQQQDRLDKANMRATETCEQALRRKQRQKESTTNKRNSIVSVEHAILVFHSAIKNGPNFVCVCYHRMMYCKSVVPCNLAKYSKCSKDLLQNVFSADVCYISNDGNEWVCMTCDRALKRGVMPLQAKANGLKLCKVPPELSDLNALKRLICRRVPFMKMVALPSGKQRSIHGPAVNVPSKVDTICNVLPRLPSQSELVPLKLKRKIEYRGHYLYDFITPQKALDALRFLKAKNPLYVDIAINEEWLEVAIANDSELCECLLEQQDESDMQTCESDDMQSVATSSQNIVILLKSNGRLQATWHGKAASLVFQPYAFAFVVFRILSVTCSLTHALSQSLAHAQQFFSASTPGQILAPRVCTLVLFITAVLMDIRTHYTFCARHQCVYVYLVLCTTREQLVRFFRRRLC